MIVCIAEKPSVAAEISKVLGAKTKKDGYFEGNGYQVTWTFGHLCCLKNPDEYYPQWKKWDINNLPMIPSLYDIRLIDDPGVKKQFDIIKDLYKKAELIINCGDAGQEGELIQRWVMKLASIKCPVKRLWISSLTEEAIREGFKNLKDQSDYDTLYYAGQARAEGDWLLGMNATRLYTCKFGGYKQILSIGRVQTPTLSMIVDRDNTIENFHPEPYWVLTTKYRNTTFTADPGKFTDHNKGMKTLSTVTNNSFKIVDIQNKQISESAPQLYDLTSLQVDCNKKFGMSAEQTLKTIQNLYEKKLTTYPRVDTKYLTDDIYSKCPGILSNISDYSIYTNPLLNSTLNKSKKVFDSSKVTDHHAIIPTGESCNTKLSSLEIQVYDLICRRFIAVFYPDCILSNTIVLGISNGVNFKVTGKTIIKKGWKIIYAKSSNSQSDDESNDTEKNDFLPQFNIGEHGEHVPTLIQKETTPPKRYTEATLLQAMETAGKFVEDEKLRDLMKENGIGRPSSRAGIIETLLKRSYIVREKKNLISTQTGRDLINIIEAKLLKSPELTGQWEKKLRDIESGNYLLENFIEELQQQLIQIIKNVSNDNSGTKISSNTMPIEKSKKEKEKARTRGRKKHKQQ